MDQNVQQRMNEFAAVFVERIKKECTAKTKGDFMAWLAKNITPSDFDFLEMVEKTLGQEAVNKWMVKILVDSGKFKTTDGVNVEAI